MKWLRRVANNCPLLVKITTYKANSSILTLRLLHHHPHKPTEVLIKVPWGHIAGLHWNVSTSAIPFVCLHGWKDNAATFNRIIPNILDRSNDYQFLSIDLPGHGFSSHYPPGMLYQLLDHLIAIRRVVMHFGWSENKIHLMGHSLGAILSFLFAASHSKLVDCVIAIDALLPVIFDLADLTNMISFTTRGLLKVESSSAPIPQTYEQIRQRILESHMSISEVACDVLMSRGVAETAPNSGEWTFTHDPRIHFLPLMGISADQIVHFAKSFQSKLLLIKAENGVSYISDYMEENMRKWLAEDNKERLKFVIAKGTTHHVHLEQPEKITPDILRFLKETHK